MQRPIAFRAVGYRGVAEALLPLKSMGTDIAFILIQRHRTHIPPQSSLTNWPPRKTSKLSNNVTPASTTTVQVFLAFPAAIQSPASRMICCATLFLALGCNLKEKSRKPIKFHFPSIPSTLEHGLVYQDASGRCRTSVSNAKRALTLARTHSRASSMRLIAFTTSWGETAMVASLPRAWLSRPGPSETPA